MNDCAIFKQCSLITSISNKHNIVIEQECEQFKLYKDGNLIIVSEKLDFIEAFLLGYISEFVSNYAHYEIFRFYPYQCLIRYL